MVLCGRNSSTSIVVPIQLPIIDRQHRHRRYLRVGWKKGLNMKHGTQRYITEIGRCTMIAHDTVGQERDGMRVVTKKHARCLHTNAAPAIRMI